MIFIEGKGVYGGFYGVSKNGFCGLLPNGVWMNVFGDGVRLEWRILRFVEERRLMPYVQHRHL
jgi:hypothetical protein